MSKDVLPANEWLAMMKAAKAITDERVRQINKEGWTPEYDDHHVNGELAEAASCYALIASASDDLRDFVQEGQHIPKNWPSTWSKNWWKPTERRRDLVKAGALILAEIERLDRIEPKDASHD